jgi:hypothetical protein
MATNWRSESRIHKSAFDNLTAAGTGVPESEKVRITCPHCQYHTAWQKNPDWITCGWCFEFIGNGDEKRKAESNQYSATRKPLLSEINQLLKGKDFGDRLSRFVQRHRDRDNIPYGEWDSLPTTALQTLLNSLKSIL